MQSQGGWGAPPAGPPGPGYGPAGAPYPAGGPPQKKSPVLWIVLGCLALGVLGGVVVVILAAVGVFMWAEQAPPPPVTATAVAPSPAPAPAAPAAHTKRFVNKREGLKKDFVDNFVPLSFDYPNDWRLEPDPGNNFVKVSLRKEWKVDPTTTKWKDLELFSAGYFNVPLAELKLESFLPGGAKKIDERETKVGSYSGKELRAEVKVSDQETLWLRVMALASTQEKNRGLLCFVAAYEESENVKTIDDVGKKGGLATILGSLRLGDDAAKGGDAGGGACGSAKNMAECMQCCLGSGRKSAEYSRDKGCSCSD